MWGGDVDCEHGWRAAHTAGWHVGSKAGIATSTLNNSAATHQANNKVTGMSMGRMCNCGAWLGSLGLEPDPSMYIQHIVECFRTVWRVLRDDGTLWLNLGDSYAGSGKGPSNSLQPEASQMSKQVTNRGTLVHSGGSSPAQQITRRNPAQFANGQAPTQWLPVASGYKPKDLMMIPARVAMALQQDGWTLRAQVPWLKRNCMPESVTDRPATAVEYVYYLSKSRRCYWDAEAVRTESQPWATKKPDGWDTAPGSHATFHRNGREKGVNTGEIRTGRNRRNSDWFFESWQGLMLDDLDEPMALVVNTAPYRGAHYATFPPKLVEPMVKASTRPGDTVLDPFAGSGTVGMVADRLGRNAVLCELSDGYGEQALERVTGDAPMFTEVEVA